MLPLSEFVEFRSECGVETLRIEVMKIQLIRVRSNKSQKETTHIEVTHRGAEGFTLRVIHY